MRVLNVDGIRVVSAATLVRPTFAIPEKPYSKAPAKMGPGRPKLATGGPRFDGIHRQVSPQAVLNSLAADEYTESPAAAATLALPSARLTFPQLKVPTGAQLPSARMGLIAIPVAAVLIAGIILPIRYLQHSAAIASRPTSAIEESAQPTTLPASTAKAQQAEPITDLSTPQSIDSAKLQNLLDTWASAQPASSAIVIKDLVSGTTITHNPDAAMASASLYKLFIAAEIYHRIDIGTLNYGQVVAGTDGRNISQCLQVMINISDNACGSALGSLVGWDQATTRAKTLGFSATDLRSDTMQTSATDVSRLLERLYSGTLLSAASSQQFMSLLKDQRINNRLPAGLPNGTTIAHKTGDLNGFTHDAGIVFGPKSTYIITAMTGPWSSPAAAAASISDLSRNVYALLNQ